MKSKLKFPMCQIVKGIIKNNHWSLVLVLHLSLAPENHFSLLSIIIQSAKNFLRRFHSHGNIIDRKNSTFQNDTQATPQISRRKLNRFLSFKNLFNFLLLAFCGYIFRAIFEGLSVMSGNRRCFHKFFLYLNLRFEIIIVCWFWFTTVFYILHYCFWYFLCKLIKKSF